MVGVGAERGKGAVELSVGWVAGGVWVRVGVGAERAKGACS